MAVHIRLTRVGATKRPAYRVIAIDSRRSRDGRALEILGFYDPLTDPITVKLDRERIAHWMTRGAKPSDAVQRLMKASTDAPTARPAARDEAEAKPRRAPRAKKAAEAAPTPAAAPAEEAPPEPAPTEPAPAEVTPDEETTTIAPQTDRPVAAEETTEAEG